MQKQTIILIVIILLGIGGFYYYQSNKKVASNMPNLNVQSFNDKAKVILTKDFTFPPSKPATIYQLNSQMGGSMLYRIFLNDVSLENDQIKFGAFGGGPIHESTFKNGVNTLRLEVDPNPEIGTFEKSSSCDIAIIGGNEGDVSSTNTDENQNILAQIKCPVLFTN